MKTFLKEPKPEEVVRHYYNSTIRIKKDTKPLQRYKKPFRQEKALIQKPKNVLTPSKKSSVKKNYQKTYKPKFPYKSIFTDDQKTCYLSKSKTDVEIHHIFGGPRKSLSEKYGFILPLTSDWHTQAPYAIHRNRKLDLEYKIKCEEYWINVLNKTQEEWIIEFGKWWTR